MPSFNSAPPLLIAGAGPTGLVLAMSLARRGVPFRIIDEHAGPGRESRAMGVHARTLEFYRQFGFGDEVVAQGIPAETVHLRRHSRNGAVHEVRTFSLKKMGQGLSPYPYLLTFPQDYHEDLLVKKLAALGVEIERNTQLTDFTQDDQGVTATVIKANSSETISAPYLIGCDGARSCVRATLKIGFPGGTYQQLFYVADVKIDRGFQRDIFVNLGPRSLLLMMPVRASGMQRLIGLIPSELKDEPNVTFENFRNEVEPLLGFKVTTVNWFSTYRVHHRVADHFRVGRAFLAGDAGHLHSPAGGQGMNTGIGDAINLGWKLAEVMRRRTGPEILDTYELERIPFARRLVATTDRAFEKMISGGLQGDLIRSWIAPALISTVTSLPATRHAAFKIFSQIAISYPDSPLGEGKAGLRGGERLPWVTNGETDNFAFLRSLDWQVHVYGQPESGLTETCHDLGLRLHAIAWSALARQAGLRENATYLVRPDGYIALASVSNSLGKLKDYVQRLDLTFNPAF